MTLTHFWNETGGEFPMHGDSFKIEEYFKEERYRELFKVSCAINGTAVLQTETAAEKGSAT